MADQKALPNFVFIYPDSLGANALGCYGNPLVQTPYIDALADQGIRFEQCLAQNPVCEPSRSCLHTGKYVAGHGLRNNNCGKLYLPHHPTFAQSLRQAGYHLSYYGKTHSVDKDQWDDVFDLYPDYNHYLAARGIPVTYPEKLPASDLCAGKTTIAAEDFSENVLGKLGEQLIRKMAGQPQQPFFLFMSHEAPHSPWTMLPEDDDLYPLDQIPLLDIPDEDFQNKQPDRLQYMKKRYQMHTDDNLRNAIKTYLSLVRLVDRNVGRLVQALDETGLRDNTIVVVMADHGDHLGNHRSMGKSWSVDQSLIHIPMIWNAPGKFLPQVNQSIVQSIDFFPTLMDIIGMTPPHGLQGQSLLPLLEGRSEKVRDYGYCAEYCDDAKDMYTVLDGQYKLTVFSDGFEELYDLKADPYEWCNLSDQPDMASIKLRLMREMIQWRFRTVDRTAPQTYSWVGEFLKEQSLY